MWHTLILILHQEGRELDTSLSAKLAAKITHNPICKAFILQSLSWTKHCGRSKGPPRYVIARIKRVKNIILTSLFSAGFFQATIKQTNKTLKINNNVVVRVVGMIEQQIIRKYDNVLRACLYEANHPTFQTMSLQVGQNLIAFI